MAVVINEMEVVPAEEKQRSPETRPAAQQAPSPREMEMAVEKCLAHHRARAQRLRAY
ncbi:MAG: hypothetical protein QOH66_1551 [Actinomycetota bacterium]|jgi:hypothetical protein|nr:hypothetical protein [Actinomycetota bacterium]